MRAIADCSYCTEIKDRHEVEVFILNSVINQCCISIERWPQSFFADAPE